MAAVVTYGVSLSRAPSRRRLGRQVSPRDAGPDRPCGQPGRTASWLALLEVCQCLLDLAQLGLQLGEACLVLLASDIEYGLDGLRDVLV